MFSKEQLQQLFRYTCALTTNEQQAYDLLQDAVEKCLRQPPQSNMALMSYTRTIIRNRYIDQFRHTQSFPHDPLEEESTLDLDTRLLEDIVIDENELDKLWEKLQPLEREILFLWAVEEYSTSEIAAQLDMPRGSVLSRIHRLRKRLQTHNGDISTGSHI